MVDVKEHREIGRCHTASFEDEEWCHKSRNAGSLLKARKYKEIDSSLGSERT